MRPEQGTLRCCIWASKSSKFCIEATRRNPIEISRTPYQEPFRAHFYSTAGKESRRGRTITLAKSLERSPGWWRSWRRRANPRINRQQRRRRKVRRRSWSMRPGTNGSQNHDITGSQRLLSPCWHEPHPGQCRQELADKPKENKDKKDKIKTKLQKPKH